MELTSFTAEQADAIARRDGDLLLDAGAGSGKTTVLVERFVRSVLEDGIEVGEILTITFTEKAAAELRQRIRSRLRELGAQEQARATESAHISTIHGFCARVLRTHALAAGLDPAFAVLDAAEADRLAAAAFDDALERLTGEVPGGLELAAAYNPPRLRAAILDVYEQLRSRGMREPRLPPLQAAGELDEARGELLAAAHALATELRAIADPGVRVLQALERLGRCDLVGGEPWPGELDALALPGGNGAALATPACVAYGEGLARMRRVCGHLLAARDHRLLDELLHAYGQRYAERKRSVSGLDFEDLELLAGELLCTEELRERYRARFSRVMVDEMQDTNPVQLALIEAVAAGSLFTVGDAQQSIYGFRHADVELFERRGRELAGRGARATLQTNFRSRPELLEAINAAFAVALGERFRSLRAGRSPADAGGTAPVELLIADKGADWDTEGLAAPWRLAEARALAARVRELLDAGASPGDAVVLSRASTDLRVYERALEDAGVPTYLIGGRGYWSHPQVLDLIAYLQALANPREEQALYTVLCSPLVGIDVDALVTVAAVARSSRRDPWWVLREPGDALSELDADVRERLERFARWFAAERGAAVRIGVPELLERALEHTGYDLAVLAMAGGQRRLANVRKLMRLAGEHELDSGRDLPGFLALARRRAASCAGGADSRESEAPVESEALDAVRLMTIHRAKGLEFPIVCVADLGRVPVRIAPLMRVGADGRFGLRLSRPGTGKNEPVLDYAALDADARRVQEAEDRRLYYVAVTRAQERLILSGAAQLGAWAPGATPITWLAPAFLPEIARRTEERAGVGENGVLFAFVRPQDVPAFVRPQDVPAFVRPQEMPAPARAPAACVESSGTAPWVAATEAPIVSPPALTSLSYSTLAEFARCGYRFYTERVLGLAPVGTPRARDVSAAVGLGAAERGTLIHALLERVDFRRPAALDAEAVIAAAGALRCRPTPEQAAQIAGLVCAFTAGELAARLARATEVRREQRFAFALSSGALITGALDVLARERAGQLLIVDYKSDRLAGREPAAVLEASYSVQRTIYALAALRSGAPAVEVAHVFLERAQTPVVARFSAPDTAGLERRLQRLVGPVLAQDFRVAERPRRSLCEGCPADGGLCSWPVSMTRRQAADRLF